MTFARRVFTLAGASIDIALAVLFFTACAQIRPAPRSQGASTAVA